MPPERQRPAPASEADQATVGLIVTVSFFASLGSGIVTSTTPSCVLALILFGSTPAGWGQPRGRPQSSKADQAAVGVILTVSFFASLGSGIFTSTMPSCVSASIFFGSTPAGSVIEREKDP